MVLATQFIIATMVCTVVPILIGDIFLQDASVCKRYIMGIFATLAIAQMVFLPFIIYQRCFTPYYWVFVFLTGSLCIWSVIKNHTRYKSVLSNAFNSKEIKSHFSIWMILALSIIVIQVLRVVFGQFFVYADNVLYIPVINDLIETDKDAYLLYKTGEPGFFETDRKYLFTTYFPYLASVCKLSGIHPAILVQTILPIILTLVSYALVWNYGYFLFKEKRLTWLFVFFFCVLVETMGGYDYTYANHVIAGIYFGKKIVFTILLPYILLFIAERTFLLSDKVKLLSKADVFRLVIMMLGICAPSLMGTGLAPIVLFCMGVVLVIRKKSVLPLLQMIIGMMPAIAMLLLVVQYLFFKK